MTAQEKKACEHLMFLLFLFQLLFFAFSSLLSIISFSYLYTFFFVYEYACFVRACFSVSMHVLGRLNGPLLHCDEVHVRVWQMNMKRGKRSSIFGYSFVPEFGVCVCVRLRCCCL